MTGPAESNTGPDPATGSVPPEVDRQDAAAAAEPGQRDAAAAEADRRAAAGAAAGRPDNAGAQAGQWDAGAEADRRDAAAEAGQWDDAALVGADRRDAAAVEAEADRLGERVAELEDLWRRALADLDNLRKRFARELARERAAERARVAALLLPVIDDLERALAHAKSDPGAIIEGVRTVRDHAVRLLEQLGFPRHDEVGTTFDPARHSAVAARTDSGLPPGTIVEVVQPGYGDDDNQLRPALVVVATKAD